VAYRYTDAIIQTKKNMANTNIASSSFNYIMVVLRYNIDYQDPGFILNWGSIAIANTALQYLTDPSIVDNTEGRERAGELEAEGPHRSVEFSVL
jgi:hypothetical protein